MDMKSHAQHGEDLHICRLIDPSVPIYGVDVGANDGHSWSNSYMFGLEGYNLLLIEPMPIYAQRCRDLYVDYDKVLVEETAISEVDGEATFYLNEDKEGDQLAMRSSLYRDGVPSAVVSAITVRTTPLYRLLAKHDWPRNYAFLTIDAEGCDFKVLNTARLNQFRPSVICVEEGEDHDEIERYLKRFGYRQDTVLGPNGIYVSDKNI